MQTLMEKMKPVVLVKYELEHREKQIKRFSLKILD